MAEGRVITEDSLEKLPGSVGQWLKNEIDDHTAEATMEYSRTTGSVKFHFNEEAELERISAMRYRGSSESDERKEWIGEINETRVINGIRVPSRVDISWILENEKFTWYRFEVTEAITL